MKFELAARDFFQNSIRPRIKNEIVLQRLKLFWFVWEYWPILFIKTLPFTHRINLLIKLLKVDWHILHSHRPCEIASIFTALCAPPAASGEVMVEAGCWKGGSSAKFSIVCEMLGYQLLIYDSFQGVEPLNRRGMEGNYDYSGEYAATKNEVIENIQAFGAIQVCQIVEGWYSETIATHPVKSPIRLVFIDCDLAKGTQEVLRGVIQSLVDNAIIFTQDYHIRSVRELIHSPATWDRLHKAFPVIKKECGNLSSITWTS